MTGSRLPITALILLLLPLNLLSQADTTKTDRHAFYAGTGYGSNMIYLGSTISQNLPFGYGALSYSPGGELYLTGSAFYLPGLEDRAPAFYSASVSYNHEFNSWFDIAAGVYRFMVRPELTDHISIFCSGILSLRKLMKAPSW
jgi:hypothetical protein